MHFTISRPQKKRKAQPGISNIFLGKGERWRVTKAASAAACAIVFYVCLDAQKRI
jgi:hypothetical protein